MVDIKSESYQIFESYVKPFGLSRSIIIKVYEFMLMINVTTILDMTQFQIDQLYMLIYSNNDYPLHDFSCLKKIIYAFLNECYDGYSYYNPIRNKHLTQ